MSKGKTQRNTARARSTDLPDGETKDIKPYIDPDFQNNIILTQTERLTMNSRPKSPSTPGIRTSRDRRQRQRKNPVLVKPNLMQCHSSVITDPKVRFWEVRQAAATGGYRVKVLNTINFKKYALQPLSVYPLGERYFEAGKYVDRNTKGEGEKSAEIFG